MKDRDECELNCLAKGHKFFLRLSPKVEDGTSCLSDLEKVCIDGKCKVRWTHVHHFTSAYNFLATRIGWGPSPNADPERKNIVKRSFLWCYFIFQDLPSECKEGGCFGTKPSEARKERRSGIFTSGDVSRGQLSKFVHEVFLFLLYCSEISRTDICSTIEY